MDLASSQWMQGVSAGVLGPLVATFGVGILLFAFLENMTWIDAIYTTMITLATIGYGDKSPHTNLGKILVAMYSLVGINVLLVVLQPIKELLEDLCRDPPLTDTETRRKKTE